MLDIAVDRDGVLDSPVGQVTLHIIKPDYGFLVKRSTWCCMQG